MTIRIAVGFLTVFATGLIAAPVETSARGGAFAGGRAMSFHRGFTEPLVRPAFARPLPVAARRVHTAPFAHFRHRHAPAVVWVGAPWYSGYDEPTYVVPDEQGPPESSPTTAPKMIPSPTTAPDMMPPTTTSNMRPPRLGCRAQTYNVPSEDGGERSVKVLRC
jgi:hypothetical protein